jgi:hypothetical protein
MAKPALPPVIVDLADYTESINILCHGDTGSVCWAALPNILILAIEEGTISAKRRLPPPKPGTLRKVWRVRTWPELVEAYEWVRDNPGVFEWVMIDSITKAQQHCIKHILETVVKANPSRDPHIPAQGDHFKWQLWVKEMVSDFNELPENIVWLARSMVRDDPDGNEIVVPHIEGKDYGISAYVSGEVHLLCYMKKELRGKGASAQVVRRLYTNDHVRYWCKDRYDVLPHIIENPDANKIIKLIGNSGKSADAGSVETRRKTTKKSAATSR